MINETTSHLGLTLPHPSNTLEEDVLRLRSAINGIDAKFALLDSLLASNDINLDTLQELVAAIKGDAANLLNHIGAGGAVHAAATQSLAGFMSAADKTKLDGATMGVLLDPVELSPASDGATSLTIPGGYTVGSILVFMNGSKLRSSDFAATDGTTITLTAPAMTTDEFDVVRVKRALAA